MEDSDALAVTWLADVAAPVGNETLPVMLFRSHAPDCAALTGTDEALSCASVSGPVTVSGEVSFVLIEDKDAFAVA